MLNLKAGMKMWPEAWARAGRVGQVSSGDEQEHRLEAEVKKCKQRQCLPDALTEDGGGANLDQSSVKMSGWSNSLTLR